jgi:PHD/YefM family antitoxin component YafN of YafNO toxin-antitoxin module
LTTADAQAQLPEIVQQVAADDKRVILLQDGQKMAAIISMEAFEFLERMVEKLEDEIDIADSLAALAEAEEKGTIPWEDLRKELVR